jgi:hypothetical protein
MSHSKIDFKAEFATISPERQQSVHSDAEKPNFEPLMNNMPDLMAVMISKKIIQRAIPT